MTFCKSFSAVVFPKLTGPFSLHTTSSTRQGTYWVPSKELGYKGNETSILTIVFVQALRILYKHSSADPIFPADEPVTVRDHEDPLFRNSDPLARPFACIDYTEVCLADGKTCWPFDGASPDDVSPEIKFSPEFWIMYASLLKTNIFYSLIKRLGRGLLAQKLVAGYVSEGSDGDHWVNEVRNLVETIHARAQINAWNIASGADEGEGGYYRASNPDEVGNWCHRYKFFPTGECHSKQQSEPAKTRQAWHINTYDPAVLCSFKLIPLAMVSSNYLTMFCRLCEYSFRSICNCMLHNAWAMASQQRLVSIF